MIADWVFEALFLCLASVPIMLVLVQHNSIILNLKINIRKIRCQLGITIIVVIVLLLAIYIFLIDSSVNETMLNRIDVFATAVIAASALGFHFHLQAKEERERKKMKVKFNLDAIMDFYIETEKKSKHGLILVRDKEILSLIDSSNDDRCIHVNWTFSYLEPAKSGFIEITIIITDRQKNPISRSRPLYLKYRNRTGVSEYIFGVFYGDEITVKNVVDNNRPISVSKFYPNEWNNIVCAMTDILNEVTVNRKVEKIAAAEKE